MQERVLGAIIIGGIACVGVVWALIDGIPPLFDAKKQEAKLENTLVEKVNNYFKKENISGQVSSLDVRRASFVTEDIVVGSKFNPDATKKFAIISLEGYNDSNKLFQCKIQADTNYILDLQNKIGSFSGIANDELQLNLFENYSITTPNLISRIIDDENTTFVSYAISDGMYGALVGDSGTRIVGFGDPSTPNGKKNNPYSVSEVLALTEAPKKEIYCFGRLTEAVKNADDGRYDLWLSDGQNQKALKCEKVSIGSKIDNIENEIGKYITFKTGLEITEDGRKVLKEIEDEFGEMISSSAENSSGVEPTLLGSVAISASEATNRVNDYKYGQIGSEEVYVTGVVTDVKKTEEDKKVYYTFKLITEGKDKSHYFEVKRALIDANVVDQKEIKAGDTITVTGKLTAEMCFSSNI